MLQIRAAVAAAAGRHQLIAAMSVDSTSGRENSLVNVFIIDLSDETRIPATDAEQIKHEQIRN